MIKYKLTNADHTTYGGTQWGMGVSHEASGEGGLCGPGYIHYYDTPELAVLLNPIHGKFKDPVLWEVNVEGTQKHDCGLKSGATRVTTIRTLPLPQVTVEQRVKFGILAVLEVYRGPKFVAWAEGWLSGKDRSIESTLGLVKGFQEWGEWAEWGEREEIVGWVRRAAELATATHQLRAEEGVEWTDFASAEAAAWAARLAVEEGERQKQPLDLPSIVRRALGTN